MRTSNSTSEVEPGATPAFQEGDRVKVRDPARYGLKPTEAVGVVDAVVDSWPRYVVAFPQPGAAIRGRDGREIPRSRILQRFPAEALEKI